MTSPLRREYITFARAPTLTKKLRRDVSAGDAGGGGGGLELGRGDAVGDDAVAPLVLGAVEGRVGQLDQLDGVARVVRVGGDADADGHAQRLARVLRRAAPHGREGVRLDRRA